MSQGFDYEKMKNSILSDSTLSQKQKDALLADLDRKIGQGKQLDIKIEADAGVLKELATENAELRAKVKDESADADRELAQGVRDSVIEKFGKYGLECPPLDSKENLANAVEIIKKIENLAIEKVRNEDSTISEGSAPLNEAQYGHSVSQGFSTPEAMLNDLYERQRQNDPEAKRILDALWEKAYTGFKDKKYGTQEFTAPEDFLRKCVEKSDEYKDWLNKNRRHD
jgi:hypothetical protein